MHNWLSFVPRGELALATDESTPMQHPCRPRRESDGASVSKDDQAHPSRLRSRYQRRWPLCFPRLRSAESASGDSQADMSQTH